MEFITWVPRVLVHGTSLAARPGEQGREAHEVRARRDGELQAGDEPAPLLKNMPSTHLCDR